MTRSRNRLTTSALIAGLGVAAILGCGVTAAVADSVCIPGGDVCVVVADTVSTPLGPVTVTTEVTNVVTVHLAPTSPHTLILGVAFAYPPLPSGLPGYTRTSITTSAAVINVDTIAIPPGPPGRTALPNLAIVSIHPPGPCRAVTSGSTVVFTPVAAAGSR